MNAKVALEACPLARHAAVRAPRSVVFEVLPGLLVRRGLRVPRGLKVLQVHLALLGR